MFRLLDDVGGQYDLQQEEGEGEGRHQEDAGEGGGQFKGTVSEDFDLYNGILLDICQQTGRTDFRFLSPVFGSEFDFIVSESDY